MKRDLQNAVVAGVCAGLARWLRWDQVLVRLLFLALCLFVTPVPPVLLYLALWVLAKGE